MKKIKYYLTVISFFILSISPVPGFAFDVNVVQGNATVNNNGNTITITATGRAILQGNTSIPVGTTVKVVQGANDILLRDSTGNITSILGSLLSSGNIILINSMGVYIGKSANINVNGLIASSLDIKNQLFMNGSYQFQKVPGLSPAQILNEANITVAPGGYVILLGDRVDNRGTITAYMGSVAFGSGQQATVSFDQGGLVNLVIDKGLAQQLVDKNGNPKAQIVNSGKVYANGGKVQMSALLLETTLAQVVNNTGNVQADKVVNEGGYLDLTANGAIDNSGTMQAGTLTEKGETFHSTGTLDVGKSSFDNLDGAISISGYVSGTISDVNDIDFAGDVILSADTTLQADSGNTGTQGQIVMNGYSLTGSGYNLTMTAGLNDILDGSITGVNLLTLNSSTANSVTFTSTSGSGEFSVNTLKTNFPAAFSRNEVDGFGTHLIFSDSNAVGGLQYIATNSTTLGLNYALVNNIDASDTSSWNAGAGFTPLGSFTGSFNGINHTISNLTIDLPASNNVGLFGQTSAATIENIGLLNVNITGSGDVGALVGFEGSDSLITNSYSDGTVNGSSQVGGLAGDVNASMVSDSFSGSTVNGANASIQVGGLVGNNEASSTITNSYATGNVTAAGASSQVGGLAGSDLTSGIITKSYATGNVSGASQVGGLVGYVNSGSITNSFATGTPSGTSNTGGLVGLNTAGSITNSYFSSSAYQNGLGVYDDKGASDFYNPSNAVYNGGLPWDFTNTWVAAGNMYPLLLISFDIWSGIGNWSNPANWSHGAVPTSTSNVLFNSTSSSSSIIDSAFGGDIANLVITSGYNGTITQNTNLSISGNYVKSSGAFTASGSTTTFSGTGVITSDGSSFDNISIGASGTYTLTDGLMTTGDFTQTSGTFVSNPANTTFSIGGSFSLLGGTFKRFTGQGTTLNPYSIYDIYGLEAMGEFLSGNFELAGNINASATSNWNADTGFVPVGNGAAPFTGTFNGQNYTISNLFINLPTTDYIGLFGETSGASVKNVGMATDDLNGHHNVGGLVGFNNSSDIENAYSTGTVSGSDGVGGLVGYNYLSSSISDSYSSANVTDSANNAGGLAGYNGNGSSIVDSYATGTVSGVNYIGGLVGDNYISSNIINSYASGNVSGTSQVGGLAGSNDTSSSISFSDAVGTVTGAGNEVGGLAGSNTNSSSISYSGATGNVGGVTNVGGLVGYNDSSSISNTYATGNVTASGSSAGGLVGYNNASVLLDSFATGLVTGSAGAGGLVGDDAGGSTYTANFFNDTVNSLLTGTGAGNVSGITGESTANMQSGSVFRAAATGWDFNGLWVSPSGSSYPTLMWQDMNNGNFTGGTILYPLLVNNVNQLQFMGYELGDSYDLNADIAANATSGWNAGAGFTPVGSNALPFTGSFNGKDHDISSLSIDLPSTNDVGLWGEVSAGGEIKNVNLLGVSITGQDDVGSLVGYNLGNIGNVDITGSVNGRNNVGGLAGYNKNSIATGITGSFASVTVDGAAEVGGFVGYNDSSGNLSQDYATGNVIGSGNDIGGFAGYSLSGNLIDNYAMGNVTGSGNDVGGFIGNNNSDIFIYNNATGNVSGSSNVGGLVGINNSSDISYSYATGNVSTGSSGSEAGGLVGSNNSSSISTSYAQGNVSGGAEIGGLVGYNSSGSAISNTYARGSATGQGSADSIGGLIGSNNSSTVLDSYSSGLVTGATNVGGLIGNDSAGTYTADFFDNTVNSSLTGTGNNGDVAGITEASTANMQTKTIFNSAGWEYTHLWMNNTSAYPAFVWQGMNNGSFIGGTLGNPFLVNNAQQLQFIGYDLSAAYQLASNIDASITSTWNSGAGFIPIGNSATPFTGSLNGNYYAISGLFIDRPTTDDVGLFGEISSASSFITNVGLVNANITGQNNVGALAGVNSVGSVNQDYATGSVTGTSNVGGLIGDNMDTVYSLFASVTVSGGAATGGLIGNNSATIQNSYATGNVSGTSDVGGLAGNSSSITDSYATGNVSGSSSVGGLVGNSTNNVIDSFATGTISGGNSSDFGGLVGTDPVGTISNSYSIDSIHQNGLGSYDSAGASDFLSTSNAVYNGSPAWDFSGTWVSMAIEDPHLLFTFDVWTGTGNWSSVANWSRGEVPNPSSNVLFRSTNSNASTVDTSFAVNDFYIQSGYTGTVTQNDPLTLSGTYIQEGGTYDQNEGLSIAENYYHGAGTFNFSSLPVSFTGSGTITSGGSTFGSLTVNATGTYTLEDALTVNNDMTVQSGTFDTGTNTVTFNGSGTSLFDPGAGTFYGITHSGTGTLQLTSDPLTVTNNFTNSSGIFDLNGQGWTMTSASFSNNNGTVKLNGNESVSGLAMDTAHGTVVYDGTSTYSGLALGNVYYNLNFNGTGGEWDLTSPLTVNGALGVQAGTFNANGQPSSIQGLTTLSGGIYQASSSGQAFNGGLTVAGGTLTGAGGPISTINMTLTSGNIDLSNGTFGVGGAWVQNGGSFNPGNSTVVFAGTSTIGGSVLPVFDNISITGTLTAPGIMDITGNWANTGTFNANNGTVVFNSSGLQTLNAGGSDFYNITHSGAGTLQLSTTPLTVTQQLTNSAGTFDLNGQDWTMTGAGFSNTGILQLQGSETVSGLDPSINLGDVVYDGTAAYSSLALGNVYNNLTFDGPGGTWNLSMPFMVKGNFILSNGTLSAPSNISLIGNWSDNGGIFNANGGNVSLDGHDQLISGNNTFYGLTAINGGGNIVTFNAGDTQTVTGYLNLNGSDIYHQLALRSSSSPTQWLLDLTGSENLNYLNVKDSQGVGKLVTCLVDCTDSGNNSGWFIKPFTFPLIIPVTDQLLMEEQDMGKQGNNAATLAGQSRFVSDQGINDYWIPYSDRYEINGLDENAWYAWGAGLAVKAPWGVELLSK